MNMRPSYILLFISALALVGQISYRFYREKKTIEGQYLLQKEALVQGINRQWRQHLLMAAQQNQLQKTYQLEWNRIGTELRDAFFPIKPSSLKWEDYRAFKKNKQESQQIEFLNKALSGPHTWDRTLALGEVKDLKTKEKSLHLAMPSDLTEYEKTILDPEARKAYELIFSLFASTKDFTLASEKVSYDLVFYFLTKEGSLVAFVPSKHQVQKDILPPYLNQNKLPPAQLGETPWELVFEGELWTENPWQWGEMLSFAIILMGLTLGIVFLIREVSQQKKQLLRKVTFLNQVIHEFKTPLAGLKLHLQMIQRGHGTPDNFNYLNLSLDRLNHLFDDVLMMNRPFAPVVPEKINLKELTSSLYDLQNEFVRFSFDLPEETLLFLIEPKRFRIIARNLIKNGIRYGQSVKLTLRWDESFVYFLFADQGLGVAKADAANIFKEFYRTDQAQNMNPDGLGLGLFLSQKMAEEMGSQLSLVNAGEAGAIFQLKIRRVSHV